MQDSSAIIFVKDERDKKIITSEKAISDAVVCDNTVFRSVQNSNYDSIYRSAYVKINPDGSLSNAVKFYSKGDGRLRFKSHKNKKFEDYWSVNLNKVNKRIVPYNLIHIKKPNDGGFNIHFNRDGEFCFCGFNSTEEFFDKYLPTSKGNPINKDLFEFVDESHGNEVSYIVYHSPSRFLSCVSSANYIEDGKYELYFTHYSFNNTELDTSSNDIKIINNDAKCVKEFNYKIVSPVPSQDKDFIIVNLKDTERNNEFIKSKLESLFGANNVFKYKRKYVNPGF